MRASNYLRGAAQRRRRTKVPTGDRSGHATWRRSQREKEFDPPPPTFTVDSGDRSFRSRNAELLSRIVAGITRGSQINAWKAAVLQRGRSRQLGPVAGASACAEVRAQAALARKEIYRVALVLVAYLALMLLLNFVLGV